MRKLVLFTIFLLLNLQLLVVAQDDLVAGSFSKDQPLQVGFRLTGLTNFMHWQTSEPIDFRYKLRPFLSGAVGFVVQEPVTKRLKLEMGISVIQLGMSWSVGTNYRPNQRKSSSSRSKYTMYVLPLNFLYQFNQQKPSVSKYMILGTNIYYNSIDDINRVAVITSTKVDINSNDTTQISESQRSVKKFSPTIVVGTGWQKRWSKRSALDIRLTGSLGISPLIQTFLTVTVRNQGRYYAPSSSTNELVNRGTFVGIDLCYLFSFH